MKKALITAVSLLLLHSAAYAAVPFSEPYPLEVLPAQAVRATDEKTGVELLYLTSGPSENENQYFHERSWLEDGSLILYHARNAPAGSYGYIVATGERIRLAAADGTALTRTTAAVNHPGVYGMAGDRVFEMALDIALSENPAAVPSVVMARQRELCSISGTSGAVNESCDGRYLALGAQDANDSRKTAVIIISTEDGRREQICGMPEGTTNAVSHVQWSTTNPHWISFANAPIRIWVVDIRDRKPWAPYLEWPQELVTHESWWVDDQILFCGGIHPKPTEDSHVKTLDPRSGQVRIVGEGAWWPEATPPEVAKRNWWHAAGSPDGCWVAADNWHGDIMLFEGLTTRPRLLTTGHRTYGAGEHPEVGWDRRGEQVIFASHKLGEGVHACVATIPAEWQEELREAGRRVEAVTESGKQPE